MRKTFALLLAAMLVVSMTACSKPAEETTTAAPETTTAAPETTTAAPETTTAAPETTTEAPAAAEPISVTITIADAGVLEVTAETLPVADADEDGAITVYDALVAVHEEFCEEGADGFAAENGDWGLSITRLWGVENGGSYGYYVNNIMAMSLVDPLAEGDCVVAYTYADLEAWSDMYTWFDPAQIGEGETELTLMGAGFDENWAPVEVPVEGAKIIINGAESDLVTDADGKVTVNIEFGKEPTMIISAVCDEQVIVPPVCVASK